MRPDHGSVEHVHRGKQGRCPVPLVVMGHGSSTAFLERQAGLRSVERLDLALFVDAEHDGVRRRIDIEPDNVAQRTRGLWTVIGTGAVMRAPDALNRLTLSPAPSPSPRRSNASFLRTALPSSARRRARRSRRSALRCAKAASCRGAVRRLLLEETLLPAPDAGLGLGRATHNLVRADAIATTSILVFVSAPGYGCRCATRSLPGCGPRRSSAAGRRRGATR